ncbi:MAG: 16S rRNA (guanine(527)-N(7))-methyltransferase RsmG [Planctomycetota bacterium]|nr:MAG: 16S rRNA (guanine(527)-N(7))-methyltransferase RsmG [Planctomycetota bacterium]
MRDKDEAWVRHVLDSLTLMPVLAGLEAGDAVADVGAGGGAPGLVLAIARPDLRWTLIESTGKKARFLIEAAGALGLANVEIVARRAEDAGRDPALRGRCSAATARALGPLPTALELVMPMVRPGGLGLFIKGAKAGAEIESSARAAGLLRCEILDCLRTPTGRIVVVEQSAPTPRAYPRRPGDPKRAPL